MEEITKTQPSETDKVFAQRAINLANTAAMSIEEGQSYIDGIKDYELKKKTQEKFDRTIEFL